MIIKLVGSGDELESLSALVHQALAELALADAVKVETVVYRENAGIPRGHSVVSVRLQQSCEPVQKPWDFQVEIRREQSTWVIRKTLPSFGNTLIPIAEFDFP